MNDNKTAHSSDEYDVKIRQTIPYYEEFYKQITELVKIVKSPAVSWLDIGCGTGKMAGAVFEDMSPERFVFLDSSEQMIKIAKEKYEKKGGEFVVGDLLDMGYEKEFDVVTAVQVNHYLQADERKLAVKKCYNALKKDGLFITFENFAPFTETGVKVSLERWKRYQISQGKSAEESRNHIERYGTGYFPITVQEHLKLLRECGFKAVEILWLSNMQAGFWGMK